jgi:dihydroxyacid dehydratase/phosphogluconate dehydratase
MKRIIETNIDQIVPGTMIGGDVLDLRGNMLVKAGVMLDAKLMDKLKSRGVSVIPVLHEFSLTPDEINRKSAEVRQRLDQRFRAVAGEPLMQELKAQLLKYRISGLNS